MRFGIRVRILCGVFLVLIPLHFTFYSIFRGHCNEEQFKSHFTSSTIKPPIIRTNRLRLVYLVQVPKCLPKTLLQDDYLGNSSNHDVIVLSFKAECMDDSSRHVEYIHGQNITWNEGRNVLYRRAQARNFPYLYYLFLDDDIRFDYHPKYTPTVLKSTSPLRAFEAWLLSHEPAIGVTNYETHHSSDKTIKAIKKICTDANITSSPQYIPVVHFDASFNAFHRDVIHYILPYTTAYDNVCWWHSQRFVIATAELMFRGHTIMFTPVVAKNPFHGDYPRNDQNFNKVWSVMVKRINNRVPKEYQSQEWIQEFINDPKKHTETSQSLCMELPSHHPIIPFSHFTFNEKK